MRTIKSQMTPSFNKRLNKLMVELSDWMDEYKRNKILKVCRKKSHSCREMLLTHSITRGCFDNQF